MKKKFVFKIKGSKPDPVKEAQKEALKKQIADMEALLGEAKEPVSGKFVPKPPKRKVHRRIIEGPSVKFNEWSTIIYNGWHDKHKLIMEPESNRIDIIPHDEKEKWRLTTLAYIGAEFCSTLFYGWGGETKLNIKKHTVEFYKKEKMSDVIAHLLNSINKF